VVPKFCLDALEPTQSHATVEPNKTIGHLAQTKFHHDLGFHAEIRPSGLHQNYLDHRVLLQPWKYAIIFTRYSTASSTGHYFIMELILYIGMLPSGGAMFYARYSTIS
jgi:hypothetical protein